MLSSKVTSSARRHRHVDDRVNHRFAAQRLFESHVIGGPLHRVAAIRNNHEYLAARARSQLLRSKINAAVKRCRCSPLQAIQGVVDMTEVVGEGSSLAHII